MLAGRLKDVRPQAAAPLFEAVYHYQTSRKLAAVSDRFGNDYAVLNYLAGSPVVVPHQVIKMGAVDQQNFRVVHPVFGVGRHLAGRVVFQVDTRQAALGLAKKAVLVLLVILASLK